MSLISYVQNCAKTAEQGTDSDAFLATLAVVHDIVMRINAGGGGFGARNDYKAAVAILKMYVLYVPAAIMKFPNLERKRTGYPTRFSCEDITEHSVYPVKCGKARREGVVMVCKG